jgi:hypothetical protein
MIKEPYICDSIKLCRGCYEKKNKFPVIKGKEKSICEDCYTRQYGDIFENHKKIVQKRKQVEETVKQKNIKFIFELLKTSECLNCKCTDFRVLEFDHRYKETKDDNISNLIINGSLSQLKQEISKCDILCANCHKIKTHKENNSWKHQYYEQEQLKLTSQEKN